MRRTWLIAICSSAMVIGSVVWAVIFFDVFKLKPRKLTPCQALGAVAVDKAAPGFALPNLLGKQRRFSEYRDKVVVINFWASWCPPCVEELPSLVVLSSKMKQQHKDFEVLLVSVDESEKDVMSFLKKEGWSSQPLEILLDPSRRVPSSFGATKFPYTYLIDRKGRVRYRVLDGRDWSSAKAMACVETIF